MARLEKRLQFSFSAQKMKKASKGKGWQDHVPLAVSRSAQKSITGRISKKSKKRARLEKRLQFQFSQ